MPQVTVGWWFPLYDASQQLVLSGCVAGGGWVLVRARLAACCQQGWGRKEGSWRALVVAERVV